MERKGRLERMGKYIIEQIEWVKSIFSSEDTVPNSPDHKTAIVMAFAVAFVIAFLKKTVQATEIPEIPQGWLVFFLAALGIRSAQTTIKGYFNGKSNGNGTDNVNGGNTVAPTQTPK